MDKTVWTSKYSGRDVMERVGNETIRNPGGDDVDMGQTNSAFTCDETDSVSQSQEGNGGVEGGMVPCMEVIALETFSHGDVSCTIPEANETTSNISSHDRDLARKEQHDEVVEVEMTQQSTNENVTAADNEDICCSDQTKDDLDTDFGGTGAAPRIRSLTNMRDVNSILNDKLSTCDDLTWKRIMATMFHNVTSTRNSASSNQP